MHQDKKNHDWIMQMCRLGCDVGVGILNAVGFSLVWLNRKLNNDAYSSDILHGSRGNTIFPLTAHSPFVEYLLVS